MSELREQDMAERERSLNHVADVTFEEGHQQRSANADSYMENKRSFAGLLLEGLAN